MHIHFTENDCSGVFQSRDDLGVHSGYPVFKGLKGTSRSDARCIKKVFYADRNSMQRAFPLTVFDLCFGILSFGLNSSMQFKPSLTSSTGDTCFSRISPLTSVILAYLWSVIMIAP